MSVFFNDDYVAPEHDFDTTRKAGWIAGALHAGRLPKVELVDPAGHLPLAEQAIESIHTAEYVEARLLSTRPSGWCRRRVRLPRSRR